MADESLSWEMKLIDGMSRPLDAMEERFEKLAQGIGVARTKIAVFESAAAKAGAAINRADPNEVFGELVRKKVSKDEFDPRIAAKMTAMFTPKPVDHAAEAKTALAKFASSGNAASAWTQLEQGISKAAKENEVFTSRSYRMKRALSQRLFGNSEEESIGKIESGFETIKGAGLSAAAAVGTVAAAMAAAAGALLVAGGKWAVHNLSFQEDSLAAFKIMLGSQEAADRTFKQATKFAATTPFSSEEVISGYQRFLTAGFGEDKLDTLMKAVGDVGANMGNEKMQSVSIALGQIKAKGKLQGEEMMQLAEAGVGQMSVFEALERILGKSNEAVKKLVTTGKVTGEQGVEAVIEAIRQTQSGGELGSAMKAKSRTLTGLFSSAADIPSTLLFNSNALASLDPIKDLVDDIIASFDEGKPLFKRGTAMIDGVAKAWARAFATSKDVDVEGLLGGAIDMIGAFGEKAAPFVSGFVGEMATQLQAIFGSTGKIDPKDMEAKGAAIAKLIGIVLWTGDAIADTLGHWADAFIGFWEAAGNLAAATFGGADINPDEAQLRKYDQQARMYKEMRIAQQSANGQAAAPNISTSIGQVVVQVQPGQEEAGLAVATDVRAQLPNQLSNWALEHGG